MEQLYSLANASRKLDVSIKTIRRLIKRHDLELYHVGNRLRIRESDLKLLAVKTFSLEDIIDEKF